MGKIVVTHDPAEMSEEGQRLYHAFMAGLENETLNKLPLMEFRREIFKDFSKDAVKELAAWASRTLQRRGR